MDSLDVAARFVNAGRTSPATLNSVTFSWPSVKS
jgi:hypothetical protein